MFSRFLLALASVDFGIDAKFDHVTTSVGFIVLDGIGILYLTGQKKF